MKTNISFAITACNEHIELKRLLEQIKSIKREEDEIILQLDIKYTPQVEEIAKPYNPIITALKNDFANFKNILKQHCKKNNFIIFLDADEILSDELASSIHFLIEMNPEVDCWAFPRVNTVEGIENRPDLVKLWGWNLNEDNWINYPDYQLRGCLNKPEISWVGKVHERLSGFHNLQYLPSMKEWSILHDKKLDKQIKQNELYSSIN